MTDDLLFDDIYKCQYILIINEFLLTNIIRHIHIDIADDSKTKAFIRRCEVLAGSAVLQQTNTNASSYIIYGYTEFFISIIQSLSVSHVEFKIRFSLNSIHYVHA